jgi:hypothetical protein
VLETEEDDVRFTEALGTAGPTTRHGVLEDLNLQQHCCEDVRSRSGRCFARRARQEQDADVGYCMVCPEDGGGRSVWYVVPYPSFLSTARTRGQTGRVVCYLSLRCCGVSDLEWCTCVFLLLNCYVVPVHAEDIQGQ